MSKKRSDLSGDGGRLADNPFSGLANRFAGPSPMPFRVEAPPQPDANTLEPPYTVAMTRKGGLPIFIEKRAKGKTVTVVRNVGGNAEALLKVLKKRCGAGGVVREGDVEVQGDHRLAIEEFLRKP